jgi:hypothetical protein
VAHCNISDESLDVHSVLLAGGRLDASGSPKSFLNAGEGSDIPKPVVGSSPMQREEST